MLSEVYIGLGSNLGRPVNNMVAALALMREFAKGIRSSPLYRTAPQGFRSQPPFFNAVCRMETTLTPFELMDHLLRVEAAIGRRRVFRNSPRLLDLDMLLYDRLVLKSPPLVLPHPRIPERRFVLRPLADIAPNLKHPVSGVSVEEMLQLLPAQSEAMSRVVWQ